jgi:hypothetical protein
MVCLPVTYEAGASWPRFGLVVIATTSFTEPFSIKWFPRYVCIVLLITCLDLEQIYSDIHMDYGNPLDAIVCQK